MVDYILYIHIIAGFTAFVAAPLAIISNKKVNVHRKFGLTFFYAMAIVFVTAMALSIFKNNAFLFLIGFFSFSFVWNGRRSIRIMKNRDPKKIDHFVNSFMIALNGLLLLLAIYFAFTQGLSTLAILAFVFGSVGLWTSIMRYQKFKRGLSAKLWVGEHISNMGGGYIAALTAFSATNLLFLPEIVAWLWPTVIGTLILTIYLRKYRNTTIAH